MSGIAVTSLESIEEFEGYLSSFLAEFSLECRSLRQTILDNLADIEIRLEEAQMDHNAALENLRSQEEPSSEDYDAVERAEQCYNNWVQYRSQFDEFVENALRRLDEIEAVQQQDVSQSVRFLSDALNSAKKYLAIVPSGGHGLSLTGNTQATRSTAFAGGGASNFDNFPLKKRRLDKLPDLPNGLTWIPVDELDWDSAGDDLAYKKASEADITAMLQVFESDLLPELESGQVLDVMKLTERDKREGRSEPTKGRAHAYEFMIGAGPHSDVIAVDPPHRLNGGRYTWQSGRHRALAAKKLGWKYIPARVVGGER